MEERQDNTKNVKILLQMIKDEKLKELRENVKEAQGKAASIAKKLNEKENERRRKLKEEAELEAVAQGSTESEESVSSYNETPVETAPVEEEVKPAEVKKTKGGKKTALRLKRTHRSYKVCNIGFFIIGKRKKFIVTKTIVENSLKLHDENFYIKK